jgi:uncharacterized membrane protein YphA (DoxX/SURF4 family)
VRRLYSVFPGGRLGVGLLILRLAAGIATSIFGAVLLGRLATSSTGAVSYASHLFLALLLLGGSILLGLGVLVPSVSIVLGTGQLIAAYIGLSLGNPSQGMRFGWIFLLLLAAISIAIFFVGPGAYSIDARLYGRKRIFIPSRKGEDNEDSQF